MQKSDLPFGSEFSSNQIGLPAVLEFAKQHEGDKARFENTLKGQFFAKNQISERNKLESTLKEALGRFVQKQGNNNRKSTDKNAYYES